MNQWRKKLRIIINNPKLIINFFYSVYCNLRLFGRKAYALPLVADWGSKLVAAPDGKVRIDERLYLGGKYIGEMSVSPAYMRLGKGSSFHARGRVKLGPGVSVVLERGACVTIGDNTYITASSVVYSTNRIHIGHNCAIAWGTSIIDTDFHRIQYGRNTKNADSAPINIGNKVWIGCNSTILKGVSIGDNSVIAANTLVNRDVPPNSLVMGNPMQVVKKNVGWVA